MNCCAECHHWITLRRSFYSDGSEVVHWRAGAKGQCDVLSIETAPDFCCNKFEPQANGHCETIYKPGEPWQHYVDIPCPECRGTGAVPDTYTINKWACQKCCGTGRVRKYDDGYVGEERTRMHPKEQELKKQGKEIPPLPGTTLTPITKPDVADTGGVL